MRLALIGSREAPRRVLSLMTIIGQRLSEEGHFSYSGGAPGSDEAWLAKYDRSNSCRIIPYSGFCGHVPGAGVVVWSELSNEAKIKSIIKAREVTSYWDECSKIVQTLFARNSMQVLGLECTEPVDKVLYWAPEKRCGSVSGGTRVAVDIARRHGIECVNLYDKNVFKSLEEEYSPRFDIFSL